MKKCTLFILFVLSLFVLSSPAWAEGKQEGQSSSQKQYMEDDSMERDEMMNSADYQVQNKVETQNEGEDDHLMVKTEESMEANEDNEDGTMMGSQMGRSEQAMDQMSDVAKAVEVFLSENGEETGIGQQVKAVAQQQKDAQAKIKGQLEKLEDRAGFMKKLFGADLKAIRNLKQQMEQNQLRIQELEQLKTQVTNQAEEEQIQTLIQALTEQNTALEDQIMAEEQVKSVFGWLLKLFN